MDILSENNGLTLLFGVCWMNPHEQYGDVLCLSSVVCHDGVRGYRRCALGETLSMKLHGGEVI